VTSWLFDGKCELKKHPLREDLFAYLSNAFDPAESDIDCDFPKYRLKIT